MISKEEVLENSNDKDFVLKAIEETPTLIEFASDELRDDKEVMLEAIKRNGEVLEFASDRLKDDKEVVLTATKEVGWVVCYASERLKADRDIILEGCKIDGQVLYHASQELRDDKEVVLTGIHLSSYGIDLREDGEELHRKAVYGIEKSKLLELIQKVAKIEGIKRVRLGSLEPRIITEEFATELTKIDEFCPHFHLSLQSGCDETLKRMNRHYTCEEYKESCNILRKAFDRPALTTDVIVGFPGETEEEFEQTHAYLDEINLYEMHVFKYSRRKGTRADQMKDQIADPIKAKRSALLLAMSSKNQKEFEDSFLGETVEILLEEAYEEEGKKYFVGHTKRYQKVAVEGDSFRENEEVLVTLTGRLSSGMLVGTRIFEEK